MECWQNHAPNSGARTGNRTASEAASICMYTPYGYGGHARYTHELLLALSREAANGNVEVSLVTTKDLVSRYRTSRYPIHDVLPPLKPREEFGSTLGWAASRLIYYPQREREFLNWVRSNDFHGGFHFQDYEPWLAPWHFRLLRTWGKRLFLTVHNVPPHAGYPLAPPGLVNRLDRDSMRQCNALFVHSEWLGDVLKDFLGRGHPPIFLTPHGVWDSSKAEPGGEADAEQRARRRRLLFFGVIRPNKGLEVLLRSMQRLPGYELVIAGAAESAEQRRLVREYIECIPENRVQYIDRFLDDAELPELFTQSSLVILPYTSFTAQSGVLHDALAYRVPVVASDVGALGESVRRWGLGEVVPPGDDAALARAIPALLEPRRYEQAVRGAARAREELSWTRTAETTLRAYRYIWDEIISR